MHLRTALVCLLFSCLFQPALHADEEAQALVERAIKAVGGEASLNRAKAVEMRLKGKVYAANDDTGVPFTATALTQLPDQFKHVMIYQNGGTKVTQTQIFNGDQVSIKINSNNVDGAIKIDPDLKAALLKGRFADSLTQLTALKNKDYQLTSLGESKVSGNPVLGLKVVAPGRAEVELFFDKTSHLLVKTEHKQLDPRTRTTTRTEIIQEVFFSDYKVFDSTAEDERILKAAKIGTDGAAVLDYFKKQFEGGTDRERIAALVRQLGDDAFDRREEATNQLIALGEPAVPFLKDALKSADLEVVRRAEHCLKKIGKTPEAKKEDLQVAAAAARRLAAHKPAGSAEILLKYLVATSDEHLAREVRSALAAVAVIDGKADPVLEQAASGKDEPRRLAALEALGKTPLPPGRKVLLHDLKRPGKISVYRAGRKFMEWEITDITYLNRIEDGVFKVN
jgi:hypothetical protein